MATVGVKGLIGIVPGVIGHFVLSLSYLVDNYKCWNLTVNGHKLVLM